MRFLSFLFTALALVGSLCAQVQMRPLPGEAQIPVARAQPVVPRAQPVAPAVQYVTQPQTGVSEAGLARLRPGDSFEMRLSGMEAPYGDEFMRQYVVDGDGTVNLPYIKSVAAAGLTPGQLERSIQQRLVAAKIFTNPTVNITLQTTARVVAITGGVRQPQRLPWTADLTLRAAVDLAGGIGEFSNGKGVRHIRDGRVINTYNLKELQRNPSADPKVSPGDEVYVPQ